MADENESPDAAAPAAAKASGGGGGMMPALLIVVLMPVISFAMFKFLFIPMIKAEIPAQGEMAHEITAEDIHVETTTGDLDYKVDLDPVTANLKGTAQTRFIRVVAVLRSADPQLSEVVEDNSGRIKEVINNVIGNLTLADLEKPEIKNVIRNQMKQGFEYILKKPIIEEIVFAEFVVQ